jgi:acyl-CoA synthetase (AMP-forming)/AMP-acid ligase II/thioesterase domain-containing protein
MTYLEAHTGLAHDSKEAPVALNSLYDLLNHAAHFPQGDIVTYSSTGSGHAEQANHLSYKDLLQTAKHNADFLLFGSDGQRNGPILRCGDILMIHFDDVLDTIVWFWSAILAGAIPAISAPSLLNNDPKECKKQIKHLSRLLLGPVCLTRHALAAPFRYQEGEVQFKTFTLEDMNMPTKSAETVSSISEPIVRQSRDDTAVLLFTSGSSGNAKAVKLTHHQILTAIAGKAAFANHHRSRPFLSWIGMDHVANLTEIHLHAMLLGLPQVQISASEMLTNPLQILNLISRHQVSRTFAPNFFLARLRRLLESGETQTLDTELDLSCLEWFGSGGEANVVEVCTALQGMLKKYGARDDVIVPGFGMTETCAGCIYNRRCPSYDDEMRYEITSLGSAVPGVRMRIAATKPDGSSAEVDRGEKGELELFGDLVFNGYFNNDLATAAAFTSDGWFKTGDLAYLDVNGFLSLSGRSKDVMIVNGLKYLPHELECALEDAMIPGAVPSYFCAFSSLDSSLDTEKVVVVYLPSFDLTDDTARYETQNAIIRVTAVQITARAVVLPLEKQHMPKSTLGKLSRAKIKAKYEQGGFAEQQQLNADAIARVQSKSSGDPETEQETLIRSVMTAALGVSSEETFGVSDSVLAMGASSIDLISILQKLKNRLQTRQPLALIDILNNPTARGLAQHLTAINGNTDDYNPVVTLQPEGDKPPLWLIHPGVGEVLVFLPLAKHITDRPLHALRARGFNFNELPFTSLDETITCYVNTIKRRQPSGPYAIAGYSYGGMLAFEVTKRLELSGNEVRFCGSLNLPPHIRDRMQQLDWAECVAHLFYFVSLISAEESGRHASVLHTHNSKQAAMAYMHSVSDQTRWAELGLTEDDYIKWADISAGLQGMARDYEPAGTVKCMDVFVADPLQQVARDRTDWKDNKLSLWKDFVRDDVRFHDVQGAHYTMMSPEYCGNFAQKLRQILQERGM